MESKPVYIAHFVMIPFTGVGIFGGFKSQEWFAKRIQIFKDYTLKSLKQQTSRSFVLWLTFRPQEYDNPLVEELAQYLKDEGMQAIMTFDGLMYNDDKFSGGFKDRLMNMARIVRQSLREKNPKYLATIKEVWYNKNSTLLKRLENSLSSLAGMADFTKMGWIYLTRVDSDDMLHKDYIKNVQSQEPFPGALVCKKGYVYNSNTNQLAEWNPPTNPPFHTIIFPNETFFNAAYHKQYYRTFKSHEDIPKVFVTKPLPDYSYCVLIHNTHISTIWDHPFKGKDVSDVTGHMKDYV